MIIDRRLLKCYLLWFKKQTNHISISLYPSTIMVKAEVSYVHVIYRRKNTGHGLAFIPTGRGRRNDEGVSCSVIEGGFRRLWGVAWNGKHLQWAVGRLGVVVAWIPFWRRMGRIWNIESLSQVRWLIYPSNFWNYNDIYESTGLCRI